MSVNDVYIVTGMDAIVNPENIKPGIDLKELERKMISGGLIQQKVRDPQDRFNEELKAEAKKLGISFGEYSKPTSRSNNNYSYNSGSTVTKLPTIPQQPQKMPNSSLPAVSLDEDYSPENASDSDDEYEQEESDSDAENGGSGESQHVSRFASARSPTPDNNYNGGSSGPSPQNRFSSYGPNGQDRYRFGSELQFKTQEQERRAHIDSVIGDNTNFSFETEKREDVKCAMLAEIDSLMSTLADEDIDLSRIPRVDRNSTYEEVDSVLKMLRHKNDHTRYCSFAEEFLLFGAYALEELFDGKRTWFGRYQPDLTGWHNHVNIKLRRMRHDTGQIVNGMMQDYNIGPGARIMLELVPNMVLYSRMRKQQHGEPGVFNEEEMLQVQNNIRELGGNNN